MRTCLMNIDWNNLLKNKTTADCSTCLKDETEGITERLVPVRNKGKGLGRNTCKKKGVYKYTGNVDDCTNYKEALNLAITEITKSKRTFDKKLAGNKKITKKEFLCLCKE